MQNKDIYELLNILQCPISGGNLEYDKEKNALYSPQADVFFPIEDGIPILLQSSSKTYDT